MIYSLFNQLPSTLVKFSDGHRIYCWTQCLGLLPFIGPCHISCSAQDTALQLPSHSANSLDFCSTLPQSEFLKQIAACFIFTDVFKASEYKQYISVSHMHSITFMELSSYKCKRGVYVSETQDSWESKPILFSLIGGNALVCLRN